MLTEIPRAELFLNGRQLANDDPALPQGWYTTDLWTDYGIKFIDEARAAKKPFFLYLAHNAPHFPLQAPQDEIAKFRGKYKIGWDKLRQQRHARQIELGIVDKAWPLSPRPPEVQAWDNVSAGRAGPVRPHHGDLRGGRRPHGPVGGPVRRRASPARRAGQHADLLPFRQRRQRRERAQRAGLRAIRPARQGPRSSKGSRGPRSPTRRCDATSTSTTRAASPRR